MGSDTKELSIIIGTVGVSENEWANFSVYPNKAIKTSLEKHLKKVKFKAHTKDIERVKNKINEANLKVF